MTSRSCRFTETTRYYRDLHLPSSMLEVLGIAHLVSPSYADAVKSGIPGHGVEQPETTNTVPYPGYVNFLLANNWPEAEVFVNATKLTSVPGIFEHPYWTSEPLFELLANPEISLARKVEITMQHASAIRKELKQQMHQQRMEQQAEERCKRQAEKMQNIANAKAALEEKEKRERKTLRNRVKRSNRSHRRGLEGAQQELQKDLLNTLAKMDAARSKTSVQKTSAPSSGPSTVPSSARSSTQSSAPPTPSAAHDEQSPPSSGATAGGLKSDEASHSSRKEHLHKHRLALMAKLEEKKKKKKKKKQKKKKKKKKHTTYNHSFS